MKDRTDIPVYTWFLIGALVFSVFTFLLGIWVCSNAPRDDQQLNGPVPLVNESENPIDTGRAEADMASNTEELAPSDLVEPVVEKPENRTRETRTETTPPPARTTSRQTTSKPVETAPARPAVKDKSKSTYYIQLTATPLKGSAEKLKQQFERKGYNVYLLETRERGRTLYKVRIGVFATRDQAAKVAEKIRREDKIKPWIVQM